MEPLYRHWQGRHKFFCKGRLMLGPDYLKSLFTLSLIIFPACILYILMFKSGSGFILPSVSLFLLTNTLIYFLLSALKNPGYIPKQVPPFAIGPKGSPCINYYLLSGQPHPLALKQANIPHSHKLLKLKYCKTCSIVRPPRSSHCNLCDLCVEKHDHHCQWIGNCIGKGNYKFFISFLTFFVLLIALNAVCAGLVIHFFITENEFDLLIASIFVEVIYIALFWVVFGLCGFHFYLIGSNQTTREKIKDVFLGKAGNPWNEGVFSNVWERLWKDSVRMWFDFRKEEGFSSGVIEKSFSSLALVENSGDSIEDFVYYSKGRVNVSVENSLVVDR